MLAHWVTGSRLVIAAAFAAAVGVWAGGVTTVGLVVLLAIALIEETTDMLDGWVARSTNTATRLGGLFDPLSDSLARLTIYFAMALAGWVTIAVPLVMTGRDIVVSYTRVIQALTGGKTSARMSGKFKAIIQGGGMFVISLLTWLGQAGHIDAGTLGWWRGLAAGLLIVVTLWSLVDYFRGAWPGIVQLHRAR
jgi:CDP-diacylglycerol--glycerol-3-phosphate 3-phosphatidyltransferase